MVKIFTKKSNKFEIHQIFLKKLYFNFWLSDLCKKFLSD